MWNYDQGESGPGSSAKNAHRLDFIEENVPGPFSIVAHLAHKHTDAFDRQIFGGELRH